LLATYSGTDARMFYDGNGNVGQVINGANDQTIAVYEYDPFGDLVTSSGSFADVNPYKFSTKYQDDESGLYYYGYRFYSPEAGRWVNRDPIGESGGINLYKFFRNNGMTSIDFLGLALTKSTATASSLPIRPDPALSGRIITRQDDSIGKFAGYTESLWPKSIADWKSKPVGGKTGSVAIVCKMEITMTHPPEIDPYTARGMDGRTIREHELIHAEMFIQWWNALKYEVDQFELQWCDKKCGDLAITYANAAKEYYMLSAFQDNLDFDVSAYKAKPKNAGVAKAEADRDTASKEWQDSECKKRSIK